MCGARKGESKAPVRERGPGEKHASHSKDFCVLLRANKPESIFIGRKKQKMKEKEEKKKNKRRMLTHYTGNSTTLMLFLGY